MPSFTLDHCTLDYQVSGPVEDRGSPAVVQLHGLMSDTPSNTSGGLDLAAFVPGARVVRYDARGHGRSTGEPVVDDWLWPNLAHDLLALLEHVFPGQPVHGIGPSMGSATLLYAALDQPEKFASLTLCVPSTSWATRRGQATIYRESAEMIETLGLETYIRATRTVPQPPAVADRERHPPRVAADLLPSVLRGAAATDLPDPQILSSITAANLILAWSDDAAHPLSSSEILREALPGQRMHIARTPGELATWPRLCAEFVRECDNA
ncbi:MULTISPECIES: alpha/beta fold hydrolase [Kocuria]|uniref:Alpha/beta hydrolase n=1 Tax=Kocuria subflava TaxID=1736139 RepID=A0A846TTR8_9MICC|nr:MULTISPECIES: alpha/beta hydrolase [Kocuria]NKE08667.1 alpha/beta hydrolase [Kocuria subflava]